jgi:hypothetical protein
MSIAAYVHLRLGMDAVWLRPYATLRRAQQQIIGSGHR